MDNNEILELKEIVTDSLGKILRFIGCSKYEVDECRELIASYLTETDEDKIRTIRKSLNNVFFNSYKECVLRCLEEDNVPIPVQMFLLYGYMDETLSGLQNSIALCKLTQTYTSRPRTYAVSLFEWICRIYRGQRKPSYNDMSVDFEQELKERLKRREIDDKEYESLLNDRNKRVMYELENSVSIMKRVSGAPTRFLAIFNEMSLEKPLLKAILINGTVEAELDKIIGVDTNLFYHEYTFANESVGISNARIVHEIKPDVILLPIIGNHPMMWQEIEGRNRQSASRFFYPVFLNGTLRDSLIRNCGEYRWEYCKREQGARWQDLSDPSLCSYFVNYIQTFKKNHSLSPEQKEKINSQYTKYRHNIKEIFVEDYIRFVANEAEGNIRLNKISRSILMKFCILNKETRQELIKNSLYTEYINVVNNKIDRDKKLLATMKKRIEDIGGTIPPEIREFEILINR